MSLGRHKVCPSGVKSCHAPYEDWPVRLSDGTDPPADAALAAVRVCRISASGLAVQSDVLAVEEPLEIRLGCDVDGRRVHRAVSITMRTPGHDLELAVGFLFTEGVVVAPEQVAGVRACGAGNVVRVDLRPGVAVDLARLERHFYTASSCGVCGKASLEAVRVCPPELALAEGRPVVEAAVIHRLPEALRAAQAVFDRTGGLHAAALFDARGDLLCLREDVGRHNALDKLIGAQFLAGRTPLSEGVLLVSGRASFELVQKAAVAGIPILAAVGAPSSLAVRPGPRTRPDPARLRPSGPLQHLHRRRAHPPGRGRPSRLPLPELALPCQSSETRETTMFSLPLFSRPQPSREPFSPQTLGEGLAAARRHRHRERLSLLRRRLRPAHLHQGRPAHRHRGQPRKPHQRGHALPQGGQRLPAGRQPAPRHAGPLPRPLLRPLGDAAAGLGAGPDRPAASRRRATPTSPSATRQGRLLNSVRTIGTLGGATIDNEENYLIKKLFGGGLGVVSIENQARI